VSATATTSAFSFQVALDADQAGSIRGRIDGERLRTDWRDYPIRGSLNAETDGLSLLDVYIGEIDKASGRLDTQVSIAGTLGTPSLQGSLQLRDASIDIYRINLALRELSVDARFDTNALDFSGQTNIANQPALDANRPRARFNGRLTWRDGLPYGSLHLEGERLRVVDVPEARIEASPNLDFRIEGRSIDATGEVLVPYGRIEPADLTTAVLASGDEELVGTPDIDPAQRWAITSDIRLQLGDDVRIETLGLDARLGGALRLRTDIADNRRAQGELTVSDGKYAALGRQLDIESGGLIYNNALITDPGIELRAQKELPDNTIVGVLVRGTLRDQRLTFYSEPQLPPSQIALLITAGGSIESLSNSQAPGAARNDLLAQGGAILAQRVGSQVGIDAGIESDREGLDTSLVLGKYLSDRIYISYGISLTEAINTLKLRFTLSERWSIRTEAGKERAADIVFTLRK
jgi:translocation and assembly module TamB